MNAGSRCCGSLLELREVVAALAHTLTVVNVHTESVRESVWHKEVHRSRLDSIFGRRFYKSHIVQTLGE